MIFKNASFSSLLNLFQSQGLYKPFPIEKHSRRDNGSRRMPSNDVPFTHPWRSKKRTRVMVLTKDWMTGFWTRNWWIPWQISSLLRVILENSSLREGRRNEEETRVHCLSKRLSSPTAAITLSITSWGISTNFAMIQFRWGEIMAGLAAVCQQRHSVCVCVVFGIHGWGTWPKLGGSTFVSQPESRFVSNFNLSL